MTEIIDNIGYRGKKQNFERDAFSTIAAMKAFNENYLPDMFEVFCYETKKKYRFLRDNSIDETLGKWREVIDFTGVYPEASTDNKGIVQIGEGLSVENGIVSADTQSDENFTSELKNKLEGIDTSLYVEKEDGKDLSSNDFTDELKTKLDGIDTSLYVEKEEGKGLSTNDLTDTLKAKYDEAQKNVQSDWNQDDDLKDSYIKNKPTKLSDFENDSEFVTKTTFETVTNPIVEVIPDQATASNQLADKDFVNSSISTNTAFFKGTYDSVDNLPATATVNDYTFVKGTDELGNKYFARYKYNGTEWLYEYNLNNSSFTEDQWKAINSLITTELVTEFKGKQDKITTSTDETDFTDDSTVTEINTANPSLSKSHKLSKFLAYIKSKLVKDSSTSTDNVWTANKVNSEISKRNDKIQLIDYKDDSLHPITDTTGIANFSEPDADLSNPKKSFLRTWLQAWNYIKGKADSVYLGKTDTAVKSTGDKNGNDITTTYATVSSIDEFKNQNIAFLSSDKNYFDFKNTVKMGGTTVVSGTSIRTYATTAATYVSTKTPITNLIIGAKYRLSADVVVTSGTGKLSVRNSSNSIVYGTNTITEDGHYELEFTHTNATYYISLFSTWTPKSTGDVTYNNVKLELLVKSNIELESSFNSALSNYAKVKQLQQSTDMVALGFTNNETYTATEFINSLISNEYIKLATSTNYPQISKFGFSFSNKKSAKVTFGNTIIDINGFVCEFWTNLRATIGATGYPQYTQVFIDLICMKGSTDKTNYRIRGYKTDTDGVIAWTVNSYEL